MQKIRIIDPVEKFRHSVLFVFLFPFIFRISIRYIRHNRACEMSRYSSAQYSLYTCLVNQKNNMKRKFLCRGKEKETLLKFLIFSLFTIIFEMVKDLFRLYLIIHLYIFVYLSFRIL